MKKAIRDRLPRRPTHATVVAYLALFVALGGTGYAAATIGSAQIRNGSIRGKDIRRGTITGREVSEKRLKVAGLRTYVVTKTKVLQSFEDQADVYATCKRGDTIAGGGGSAGNDRRSALLRSEPLASSNAWIVMANVPLDSPPVRSITASVVCLQRPR